MAGLILLIGPPGAGKSVQAEKLVEQFGYVHLSSGELLRRDPEESNILPSGQLVPSADVERVVDQAVREVNMTADIILDGFPRIMDEAVWLDSILGSWNRELKRVIVFDLDESISLKRLDARGRSDDSKLALKERWKEFNEVTLPVIELYRRSGIVLDVDGRESVEAVNGIIITELR